jgi:hypothetical protein
VIGRRNGGVESQRLLSLLRKFEMVGSILAMYIKMVGDFAAGCVSGSLCSHGSHKVLKVLRVLP